MLCCVVSVEVLCVLMGVCCGVLRKLSISKKRDSMRVRFTESSRAWWSQTPNQRLFFDTIAKDLGIGQLSDWYGVYRREVAKLGGKGLFLEHHSLGEALKVAYPEFRWQLSKFVESDPVETKRSKSNTKTLLNALDKAQQQLGITKVEDWYSVTMADLREVGFPSSVRKSQFVEILSIKYPEERWEMVYMLKGRYAQQKRLERAIHNLFPDSEIKTNVRKEAGLLNPETRSYLELDLFIPSLSLAFEYQDLHHYRSTAGAYSPLHVYQQRDKIKQRVAKEKGITLVLVPCWWDGKDDSLIASIKQVRPDLLSNVKVDAKPIPEDMPPRFLEPYKKKYNVADIGEPTTACFMTSKGIDPTSWWMFEKYDGVRAFWNPSKKAFFSRFGNKFNLPDNIVASMPDIFLDGELWFGRDNFQEALKISGRVNSNLIDWGKFKYMVFDAPKHNGSYSHRYTALQNHFKENRYEFMELAPTETCIDMSHLDNFYQDIMDKGGEGIILRDPQASYEAGRSSAFLKHKKFRDAEAKIVRSVGKAQWECILPNGVTFVAVAGTIEFINRWQPKEGDIVSFKHRGFLLGSKKPKAPAIYRLRPDLTWEDVVNNFKDRKPTIPILPMRRPTKSVKPKGFWQEDINRREFLCKFAQEMGFDPLVAENWDKVTHRQIAAKGGKMLVDSEPFRDILKKAFPEVKFTNREKEKKPSNFWTDPKNCRIFFDSVAREQGFDPLDPSRWQSIKLDSMLEKKGGLSIKKHGGFKLALQRAYPELNFAFRTKEERKKKRKEEALVC